MASDRFITWLEKRPTRKTLEAHLSEFLGTGFDLKWDGDRWFVSIPGSPHPTVKWGRDVRPSPYREERFIEVIPNKELDVLTRQADPLVNSIADGLVKWLCFRLQGDSTD
jgi:hypothetical protein